MRLMDFNSPKFKELKAKWYKRLKDSGFIDIENKNGIDKPDCKPLTKIRAFEDRECREQYYSLAADFLFSFKFQSERDRVAWEFHCGGAPVRAIARHLGCSIGTAHGIIKRLRKEAGLWVSQK